MRREGLLARVVARYRRLGFRVRVSAGRRAAARVRIAGAWLVPDFCVESRPRGLLRVGFVETGPGIRTSRVDRWTRAARANMEVAVHCPARIAHLVRWWCAIRGLDLQIHSESRDRLTRRVREAPEALATGLPCGSSADEVKCRRILVVDDDPELCGLVTDILTGAGMQVRSARDGEEALRCARVEVPDAILCDILLPGMSGFTLCRRLRALPALSHVPIIVITGWQDRSALPAAFEAGAIDFLRKPFDAVELTARVRARAAAPGALPTRENPAVKDV
ncbi:MAG: response regulator [Planctomycetes bacterium]|nr:response regulator [Planctomycetota bacterium]